MRCILYYVLVYEVRARWNFTHGGLAAQQQCGYYILVENVEINFKIHEQLLVFKYHNLKLTWAFRNCVWSEHLNVSSDATLSLNADRPTVTSEGAVGNINKPLTPPIHDHCALSAGCNSPQGNAKEAPRVWEVGRVQVATLRQAFHSMIMLILVVMKTITMMVTMMMIVLLIKAVLLTGLRDGFWGVEC